MTTKITAKLISNNQRSSFLPKHFGSLMIIAERGVYKALRSMCHTYDGGYWNFYQLSNDGFYIAPESDELFPISVIGNGYEGLVTADAAGIIATLCILNELSWKVQTDKVIKQFYFLRDYVGFHPEAAEIYAAID